MLYEYFKYKPKEFTPTGQPKVDKEAMIDLEHPFFNTYKKLQALQDPLTAFLIPLERETCNGRLHPIYSLAGGGSDDEKDKGGPSSFRSACQYTNFQNYPVRDEDKAKLLREAFIPTDENYHIVETDFSQLEVRIACPYNKDPVLIRYVTDESTDMHRDAAMRLFGLSKDQASFKGIRHTAKNRFVFPQFYGSYYTDCAKSIWKEINRKKFPIVGTDLNIIQHLRNIGYGKLGKCEKKEGYKPTRGTFEYHVKEVEDYFWNKQFQVYTEWKKSWYKKYTRRGWFPLYTGFKCVGEYRRNQVINFPVQGSAFHCLLWCIIRINRILKKSKMRSRIVGQIHDSLVGDVHKDELQDYLSIVKETMEVKLAQHWTWINVPLKMEADVSPLGMSWHAKKPWEYTDGRWREKPTKQTA